jgi:hypothetical protein
MSVSRSEEGSKSLRSQAVDLRSKGSDRRSNDCESTAATIMIVPWHWSRPLCPQDSEKRSLLVSHSSTVSRSFGLNDPHKLTILELIVSIDIIPLEEILERLRRERDLELSQDLSHLLSLNRTRAIAIKL